MACRFPHVEQGMFCYFMLDDDRIADETDDLGHARFLLSGMFKHAGLSVYTNVKLINRIILSFTWTSSKSDRGVAKWSTNI